MPSTNPQRSLSPLTRYTPSPKLFPSVRRPVLAEKRTSISPQKIALGRSVYLTVHTPIFDNHSMESRLQAVRAIRIQKSAPSVQSAVAIQTHQTHQIKKVLILVILLSPPCNHNRFQVSPTRVLASPTHFNRVRITFSVFRVFRGWYRSLTGLTPALNGPYLALFPLNWPLTGPGAT